MVYHDATYLGFTMLDKNIVSYLSASKMEIIYYVFKEVIYV